MDQRGLIASDDISKVRSSTSLVELFEEVTNVKRQGARFFALCPFHQERTPSLSIDEAQGLWHCFGCQESGDAISFIEKTKHFDFPESVQYLADRAGITISYEESDEAKAKRSLQRKLHDAIGKTSGWYEAQLLESKDAEAAKARSYLKSRGWNSEITRRFGIGFAPRHGESAVKAARLGSEVAFESGVARKDSAGQIVDVLRGRITFTLFDPGGKPIAIAGRVLPGEDGPKYINFVDTPLYQKRRVLYGLNWAKKQIAQTDEVIVCEGYTDTISFHLAGMERAVATCGIALTEEHVKLLSRFAKRIVVSFDADTAGEGGVERLHQWEAKNDVEFAIVKLPEGSDPADLVEQGRSEELRDAVANAQPLLGWRVDRLLTSADLTTPEGRVRAAEAAMKIINSSPNVLLRDQYAALVADRCSISPEKLRPTRSVAKPAAKASGPKLTGPEFDALRLELNDPTRTRDWLIPVLFADPVARRVLDAVREASSTADALERADETLAPLIGELALGEAGSEPSELRARLTVAAARRAITRLPLEVGSEPDAHERVLKTSAWLRENAERARDTHDDQALTALWTWLSEHPVADAVPKDTDTEAPPDDEFVENVGEEPLGYPMDPPEGYFDDAEDDDAEG